VRSLDPGRGIQYVAYQLAREFRRKGVEVENLTWSLSAAGRDEDVGTVRSAPLPARIVASIGNARLRLAVEVPLFTFWSTVVARRRRRAGDVLLSHGDSLAGDFFVAHSCHRAAVEEKRKAGDRRWWFYPLHWFVLFRESLVFGRGNRPRLVAISRGVGEEFRRIYGMPDDRMLLIPNGVDRERFRPAPDRAALRRRLGVPENAFVLLFAGHEFHRKGLRLILEGMAQCPSAAEPILLVAGGDDPRTYRELAKSLGIDGRVHFLGRRSDVHDLYAAANLFVFLSNYESAPLVGLEALAAGLPLITTRVNGMEDFVEPEANGLFTERSAGGFASVLARVMDDPELLERLRAGARPSTEPYAWPRVAERYLEAFERFGDER
jgi:UDP-glucose:(heptosyl)LPS alpha-1,3-glucosyltransferase